MRLHHIAHIHACRGFNAPSCGILQMETGNTNVLDHLSLAHPTQAWRPLRRSSPFAASPNSIFWEELGDGYFRVPWWVWGMFPTPLTFFNIPYTIKNNQEYVKLATGKLLVRFSGLDFFLYSMLAGSLRRPWSLETWGAPGVARGGLSQEISTFIYLYVYTVYIYIHMYILQNTLS